MATFEKHIALSFGTGVGIGTISTTSASYIETTHPTYVYLDTNLYSSATYYFEAVIKTSAGTAYAQLYDTAGNPISGTEVSTASTTRVRVRSAAFTPSATGTYTVRIKNNGSNTTTYYRASIVIVQNSTSITSTETCISLTSSNTATSSTSYVDPSTIDWGFFRYTSANWDGTVAIYLEATIKTTAGTGTVALHDSSNNLVTNSECATTSASYTRIRSSAITLTNATDYKVRIKTTSGTVTIADAHLVIQQTNSPSKTECYVPLNKTTLSHSATGGTYQNTDMPCDYTSTNWVGNTTTWYHESNANCNTAAGTFEIYKETDAARLTGSNISTTAASAITRYRSGTLTMPTSQGIVARVNSASGTVYQSVTFLIAEITWTNGSPSSSISSSPSASPSSSISSSPSSSISASPSPSSSISASPSSSPSASPSPSSSVSLSPSSSVSLSPSSSISSSISLSPSASISLSPSASPSPSSSISASPSSSVSSSISPSALPGSPSPSLSPSASESSSISLSPSSSASSSQSPSSSISSSISLSPSSSVSASQSPSSSISLSPSSSESSSQSPSSSVSLSPSSSQSPSSSISSSPSPSPEPNTLSTDYWKVSFKNAYGDKYTVRSEYYEEKYNKYPSRKGTQ